LQITGQPRKFTSQEDRIGEEAAEVIIALKDKEKSAIIYEVADLCFHTLVALGNFNISPQEIFKELKRRRK
jgi:phosphoribosyl-ATP pyrophosphohydrolase